MYSTFCEMEASVKEQVVKGEFSGALDGIRRFVVSVMYGQAAPGEVVGSRKLDELCEFLGESYFRKIVPDHATRSYHAVGKRVVIICTGLYKYGGTSLLIGDLVKAHSGSECTVIATNYLDDMSREDLELSRIGDTEAVVSICPPGAGEEKLAWLIRRLLDISASRIILLNHHQDSVIISAARPFVDKAKVIFYHHADYNLCLGVHLKGAAHVDPHNVGYYNCRGKEGIGNNIYIPMTVDDLGKSRVGTKFIRNGELTTCSSGSHHKFRNFYLYPYLELLVDRFKVRNGKHIHIGSLPDDYFEQIKRKLTENGVSVTRFVHIPWTASVWTSLIEESVDLFIGSFPIGGARTTIEAMGAGLPILMPDNYLSRFFSSRDIVYPDALEWKYPKDFSGIIKSVTRESLSVHSRHSHAHYAANYRSESISLKEKIDAVCDGRPIPPPYDLYPYRPDHLDKALHLDRLDALTSEHAVQQALAGSNHPASSSNSVAHLSPKDQELHSLVSRNPDCIGFDRTVYLQCNPDVAQAGVDPLIHFVEYGQHEGRGPTFFFLEDWHAEMNEAVAAESSDLLLQLARSRSDPRRMKVAFFAYAWREADRLDPYTSEIVATLADLGVNVDVYIAGQFSKDQGTVGFRQDLSRSAMAAFLRSQSYDFALSFNNALVLPETVDALRCTIVSVIVDSDHHLFDHTEEGVRRAFDLPIHAAPIYSSFMRDVAGTERFRASASFLPAATITDNWASNAAQEPIEIVFIASMLGDDSLDTFMLRVENEVPDGLDLIARCLSNIEVSGEIGTEHAAREAARVLCDWANWSYPLLEMHLQGIVTNATRLAVVEKLAPLGLRLFGNARWRSALTLSPSVARSFRSGADLRRHADLSAVYDRSKISINVPQVHAGTGMQYRMLDILASKSLLITKRIPGSDIERLFGTDSPVVTFSDLEDLREKCAYYLKNDNERRARVKACNALVARGFSFRERVLEYLALSNPSLADQASPTAGRGSVALILPDRVIRWAALHGRRAA